jgi:branched-chain amino acid transport system permease protein
VFNREDARRMLTNLFDGLAYGMLLFVIACGLSVTLGLMNLINLAHGAFAMAGGYVTVALVNVLGVPFLLALPLAFVASAVLGLVLEKTLYVHVYRKSHLEQVLFSIGLVLMAISGGSYLLTRFGVGTEQKFVDLPVFLQGRFDVFGANIGAYRLLIVGVCGVLALVLQLIVTRTRFGAQLRAAVDDPVVARGLGINVGLVFSATFAVGSGLAGLGGALGANVLGLDPGFPVKYMVYFLIVVAVGGSAGMVGPLVAAILLGVADVSGKYYLPQFGAFIIYVLMIVVLLWRPQGIFARAGGR